MPITAHGLESEHYMVLPAPKFWNSPSNNNFEIKFSGVALIDFHGNQDGSWNNDRLELTAFQMRMDKINERTNGLSHPLPAGANSYAFVPLQWTVYGSVNSQIDELNSVNAGFGAYNFGISIESDLVNENSAARINNFAGIFVGIQVRDNDARIYRIGYSMTLYGYYSPIFIPPIP